MMNEERRFTKDDLEVERTIGEMDGQTKMVGALALATGFGWLVNFGLQKWMGKLYKEYHGVNETEEA